VGNRKSLLFLKKKKQKDFCLAVADSPATRAISKSFLVLFFLATAAKAHETRVLGLTGAANFRDLGGYATTDGRHVRWGEVYRSNALSALTPADEKRVEDLHIVAEVDLRTQQERAAEPDRWLEKPGDIYESPRPSLAPIIGPMMAKVTDAATARQWMQAFYARIPDEYRPEYAALFHRLAGGEGPLLIHCTAGKDRTGVAAAILLSALHVPRATVVKDYVLTGDLLPPPKPAGGGAGAAPHPTGGSLLSRLPPDARAEIWRTDETFVLAALKSIDAEYGSVDVYLEKGLGLSGAEVTHMRQLLTE
jgi:protein-tyrosine phosphatase